MKHPRTAVRSDRASQKTIGVYEYLRSVHNWFTLFRAIATSGKPGRLRGSAPPGLLALLSKGRFYFNIVAFSKRLACAFPCRRRHTAGASAIAASLQSQRHRLLRSYDIGRFTQGPITAARSQRTGGTARLKPPRPLCVNQPWVDGRSVTTALSPDKPRQTH